MSLIYIVEDDKNIQEIEEYALKNAGYDVRCFDEAEDFRKGMEELLPDLLVLDIMLPGEDGLSVLKWLRTNRAGRKVPVIMVTAKASEIDTVKGLDMGADDYITKPFGVMELISRVKALLRRAGRTSEDAVLDFGTIKLDTERRICMVNGVNTELTFKEYELLKCFMSNAGLVLSRDKLMDTVWDSEFAGESRTIDMHVKTLRKKLGDAGGHIITVRNVGYKLE